MVNVQRHGGRQCCDKLRLVLASRKAPSINSGDAVVFGTYTTLGMVTLVDVAANLAALLLGPRAGTLWILVDWSVIAITGTASPRPRPLPLLGLVRPYVLT